MSNYPDNFSARAFDAMWGEDNETIPEPPPVLAYRPMSPALRQAALLALSLGYGPDANQASPDAPDHVVARMVQPMMDDYSQPCDPADFETTMRTAEATFGKE